MLDEKLEVAAALIRNADALLITAGAGMGVDSGLPDFRGNEGFWQAYPALGASRIDFSSIANARAFMTNPERAWGFYGHRLELYRRTIPHEGFLVLKKIAANMANGCFVVTSNVDAQFQKAGFDQSNIWEIHGSIHYAQCTTVCRSRVWTADTLLPVIDEENNLWIGKLPICQDCGRLARPNVLMFDDWHWATIRYDLQRCNWDVWTKKQKRLVVIELGAGIDLPSIRKISESRGAPVIRINPRHPTLAAGSGISLPMGARDALLAISKLL